MTHTLTPAVVTDEMVEAFRIENDRWFTRYDKMPTPPVYEVCRRSEDRGIEIDVIATSHDPCLTLEKYLRFKAAWNAALSAAPAQREAKHLTPDFTKENQSPSSCCETMREACAKVVGDAAAFWKGEADRAYAVDKNESGRRSDMRAAVLGEVEDQIRALPIPPAREWSEQDLPDLPRPAVTYADHSYPAFSTAQMRLFVLAALRRVSRPAMGWRTIDSAPKDGTPFLARSGNWLTVGSWNKHRNGWCVSSPSYDAYPPDEQPTHWQPLPTPPQPEQGSGK